MITYNTTTFAVEALHPETQEWRDLYGPHDLLDAETAVRRYRQMQYLCAGLELRIRRTDSTHVVTTTTTTVDVNELEQYCTE